VHDGASEGGRDLYAMKSVWNGAVTYSLPCRIFKNAVRGIAQRV